MHRFLLLVSLLIIVTEIYSACIFLQVTVGSYHTCGLKFDQTAECWGTSANIGYMYALNPPELAYTKFKQISAGIDYTCGILVSNSTVYCWGTPSSIIGRKYVVSGTYKSLFAGRYHACAINMAGASVCWGNNYYGQATTRTGPFVQLSLGDIHTCGVSPTGIVSCFGANSNNQLSYSSSQNTTMVAAGGYFTCGLNALTKKPSCVGSNPFYVISHFPQYQYDMIAAGYSHICGIRSDTKTIVCSGNNDYGKSDPPSGQFVSISAGDKHSCAISIDSTVECWGEYTYEAITTQICNCTNDCNEHGLCIEHGVCLCEERFNATNFCSDCESGYYGSTCSDYQCSGRDSKDELVCSGRGSCLSPNQCLCDPGYYGVACQLEYQCLFDTSKFGAPTPVVKTRWNQTGVIFEVSMTINAQVEHFITLENFAPGNYSKFINTRNYAVKPEATTECTKQYHVFLPWNSPQVVRTYNQATEMMNLVSSIYISYVNRGKESVVSFGASQTSYANMISNAVSVNLNTVKGDVLRYAIKFVYQQNSIIIAGASINVLPGFSVTSLKMIYSSIGSVFTVTYSPVAKTNTTYDVSLYTQPGVSDITGSYRLEATLTYAGVSSTHIIPFDIIYRINVPAPPIDIKFTTDVFLSATALGQPQSTFSYGDRAFVTTVLGTYSPKINETQALKVKNAYVCCMKNNAAMPTYDPANAQFGCTVNNPTTMENWIQLVSNRVPSAISKLETSIGTDRAVFSFDVNPLTDRERTCYIHVTTSVSPNGARSIRLDSSSDDSQSFSVFRVQKLAQGGSSIIGPSVVLLLITFMFTLW